MFALWMNSLPRQDRVDWRQRFTPQAAFTELRAGHCAMALTWAAPEIGARCRWAARSKNRFALLPGATQAYRFATKSWENRGEEDRIACAAYWRFLAAWPRFRRRPAEPQRAESFVLWLAGREVSEQVGPHSAADDALSQFTSCGEQPLDRRASSRSQPQYAEVLATEPELAAGLSWPDDSRPLAISGLARQSGCRSPRRKSLRSRFSRRRQKLGRDQRRTRPRRAEAGQRRSLGQASPRR